MRAELLLRVAADPNAIGRLEGSELCDLIAEPGPPAWTFEEAARRRTDERVMAHLFSHPRAKPDLLKGAVAYDRNRLGRLDWHVAVYRGPPLTLATCLAVVVPEVVATKLTDARLERLLVVNLSPLCLMFLRPVLRDPDAHALLAQRLEAAGEIAGVNADASILKLPRSYSPLATFLLLGDFLYYLECGPVAAPNDLPVMAKVALALNCRQPLEPYLKDADLRVRRAAKERSQWNGS